VIASRTPAASGTFYASLPDQLRKDVHDYLELANVTPRAATGVLAPHAAHRYAGATAGAAFASVDVPGTCVVLAPNHTGRSGAAEGGSILLETAYSTPLGVVEPDLELGRALVERARPLLAEDRLAHENEHAVEVLLPFLQIRNSAVQIIPLILAWSDWNRTARLARAIHEATDGAAGVLVVASSNMNHYEPANLTADKDTLALDRVLLLDGEGLLREVAAHGISLCGCVPLACALEVARLAGKHTGEVVAYSHSGVVDGEHERVVSYAAARLGVA
jgi:AmmeMemoRadiSam system protein B